MRIAIARLLENKDNAREIAGLGKGPKSAIAQYAALTTHAPPILVSPVDMYILNGHHRTAAAIMRGETEIEAEFPKQYFVNEKDRQYQERLAAGQR